MALALREEVPGHLDAAGLMVAGVIGRRKFSYDLWATPSTRPAAWRPPGCPAASR
jgi:hypothetical protein